MGIFSKWVESLDYQYEILSSCSRHKSPRSTCAKCVDACDLDAISLKKGLPVINQGKCNECGKCIADCPVQAVAGIFPKRDIVQNHLVVEEEMIPSVKELLVYAKKGIQGIYSEISLSEEWNETIVRANEALNELNMPSLEIKYKKVKQIEESYTRRALFFAWKNETQSLMKEMAPAKWRFNQKDLELSKYYPDHQFAEIHLDIEKCTLCQACQKLCDKNCLNITEEGFTISTQACSACSLCENICPEKAITVSEKIACYQEKQYSYFEKECKTCGKTFHALSNSIEDCVPCVKKSKFLMANG